ncbi:hypothetical protein D9619_000976 [Psilocybe cf. subviscida]|uniref:RRM domain-containing protein n=1 Tax=Psilocybe cf. subviscida TaxID=2480587 RepID=A0A8H5BF94_9AGAR|nr:hypothetical protein D9619_000976 [Psilocybe cf. subviscida]
MSRGRSRSPRDADVDMDASPDKLDARVIIITNLTRNVAESHLRTIFGFYGHITKLDLPLFLKSGQNKGKAALEFSTPSEAHKAASHMDGGQLDGASLKVELSDLPIRSPSRSPARPPPRGPRNARDKYRSFSRSRSRSRSRSPRSQDEAHRATLTAAAVIVIVTPSAAGLTDVVVPQVGRFIALARAHALLCGAYQAPGSLREDARLATSEEDTPVAGLGPGALLCAPVVRAPGRVPRPVLARVRVPPGLVRVPPGLVRVPGRGRTPAIHVTAVTAAAQGLSARIGDAAAVATISGIAGLGLQHHDSFVLNNLVQKLLFFSYSGHVLATQLILFNPK